MVALGVGSAGPCRCRESEPRPGVAGRRSLRRGPVEALEKVAVGGDVEVLGDPHGGVAQKPGHVLDAGAGLGQGPGGKDVAQRVEGSRPGPPRPVASRRRRPSERRCCAGSWSAGASGPGARGTPTPLRRARPVDARPGRPGRTLRGYGPVHGRAPPPVLGRAEAELVAGLHHLAVNHDAAPGGVDPIGGQRRHLSPAQPRVGQHQDLELSPPHPRALRPDRLRRLPGDAGGGRAHVGRADPPGGGGSGSRGWARSVNTLWGTWSPTARPSW